jgi:hypothetical protein
MTRRKRNAEQEEKIDALLRGALSEHTPPPFERVRQAVEAGHKKPPAISPAGHRRGVALAGACLALAALAVFFFRITPSAAPDGLTPMIISPAASSAVEESAGCEASGTDEYEDGIGLPHSPAPEAVAPGVQNSSSACVRVVRVKDHAYAADSSIPDSAGQIGPSLSRALMQNGDAAVYDVVVHLPGEALRAQAEEIVQVKLSAVTEADYYARLDGEEIRALTQTGGTVLLVGPGAPARPADYPASMDDREAWIAEQQAKGLARSAAETAYDDLAYGDGWVFTEALD